MDDGLSLRKYAEHRKERGLTGATLKAVQRAIESRRLVSSVVRDEAGRPRIRSAELADAEWAATTRSERVPISVQTRVGDGASSGAPPADGGAPPGGDAGESALAQARSRYETAKAAIAELDLAEREGKLCRVADVEEQLTTVFTRCRTKLLGVPSRLRQVAPHLAAADVAKVDELVREALVDLAEGRFEIEEAPRAA